MPWKGNGIPQKLAEFIEIAQNRDDFHDVYYQRHGNYYANVLLRSTRNDKENHPQQHQFINCSKRRERRVENFQAVITKREVWKVFPLLYILASTPTAAQIVPDGTLPSNSLVIPQGNIRIIDGGTKAGSNLFHSFSQFSVPAGSAAFFNNALDVSNIFSRVTGGSISNIDGILAANGTANLFLLNPNGIIFGPGALLNIGGSFAATTANAIGFGNQGFFSATIPNNPSVLTVDPSAFLFNQIAAQGTNSIENRGARLLVNAGRSLLFVGGNVSPNSTATGGMLLNGSGIVAAPGGRIEVGGVAAPGEIGLSIDTNNPHLISLSFPNGVERADISLNDRVNVNVAGGGGGSIAINARNLNISSGSLVLAGISPDLGTVGTTAGDITVDATGVISISNSSFIANAVFPRGTGNSGNVNIAAREIFVTNGSQINVDTFGQGNTGNVRIIASDGINFDGVGSNGTPSGASTLVRQGATGNGGNLEIRARNLSLSNGAQLGASTFGRGDAGNVTITAGEGIELDGSGSNRASTAVGSTVGAGAVGNGGNIQLTARALSITNGAQLLVSTFGEGKAGNVTITASDSIKLDGVGSNGFATLAGSSVQPGATGNGGNLNITAPSLTVRNGAQIGASTFGVGSAGDVTITVSSDIALDGVGSNGFSSSAASSAQPGATGNGGNLNITARNLTVTNGAQLNTATFGRGSAGNVTLAIGDNILFDGVGSNGTSSGISSSVARGAIGTGGNINIATSNLTVRNGATLAVTTLGRGDAGNITIIASDSIFFDGIGVGANRTPVGASSSVTREASGNGGNINITTPLLSLTNSAILTAGTFGEGNAGNVNINTSTFNVANTSQVLATTASNGRGGDINVTASEQLTLSGAGTGLFTATAPNSTGTGGNLSIKAGELAIREGAQVTARSQGAGDAGNILNISARSLNLDNGSITTTSLSGNGGNINNIQVDNLLILRNGSVISATAGTDSSGGGNGGNITINPETLIALENSNISANAFQGSGGRIQISTQGLFRSPDTAITASSRLGVQGIVEINILGFDVSSALTPVSGDLLSADAAIASSCIGRRNQEQGRFVVTGTGGLPVTPDSDIDGWYPIPTVSLTNAEEVQPTAAALVGRVQPLQASNIVLLAQNSKPAPTGEAKWKIGDPIVEAQSLIKLPDGRVILSSMPPRGQIANTATEVCHAD